MSQFWPSVGGEIRMVYSQDGANLAPISLAVVPFDLTPSGPDGDYLYTGSGDVVPTESGILATFAALGALWAPYYDLSWYLKLVAVYKNVGGAAVKLASVPSAPVVQGTYTGPVDPSTTFKRTLMLWGDRPLDQRWRIFLRWLQGDKAGETLDVWPDHGGYDARDPAWFAYLGSSATGVVARNGGRFQSGGQVRQWFDTPLSPTGPYLVSG